MAIIDSTTQAFQDFIKDGGSLTFTVDARDISVSDFEELDSIKPILCSGFEIPPSLVIHDPLKKEVIHQYGDEWTKVVKKVYGRGGRIVYQKQPSGQFLATCSIPANA
ncbi:hypothetical protein [Aeromonas tecta]|uniref:hypothetical protein n=1 Tax=Aeromonas tecta TaxID=324617 RepID=UPI0012F8973B|nr:hypothetical protein [Aeromonas tecta]